MSDASPYEPYRRSLLALRRGSRDVPLLESVYADTERRARGVPPETQKRVDAIVHRLREANGCALDSLRATVVDTPPHTARIVAGRQIEIGSRLLAELTDAELAGVLAHEMGHAAGEHDALAWHQRKFDLRGRERRQMDLTQPCAEDATSRERVERVLHDRAEPRIVNEWTVQEDRDPRYENEAGQGMHLAWREMQADAIAIRLLARAGYPPQATRDFLQRVNEAFAERGGEVPYGEARIEHMDELLQVHRVREILARTAHAAVATLPPGTAAPDRLHAPEPDTPVPQREETSVTALARES